MTTKPVYLRVKEQIRTDFVETAVEGGNLRLPSERELQARYQVSRPTISKALTSLAGEGQLVRAQGRRHFAVPQPSRAPDNASPALRIGYVAGGLSTPLTPQSELLHRVYQGISEAAHRRRGRVFMGAAGGSMEGERAAALDLIAAGARGLVIWPSIRTRDETERDYLRTEALGVPIVLVDNAVPEQGHTQILFDNHQVGYNMISWLIQEGHRRIGLLTLSADMLHVPLQDRLRGYCDALHDHAMPFDPALVQALSFESAIQHRYHHDATLWTALSAALDDLLGLPHPPTAIIALEDLVAIELTEMLERRGVRVPDEICVVGFDNLEIGRRFRPAFTTTQPNFRRMGELACSLLWNGIEAGGLLPRTYMLEAPLLIRSGRPALQPTTSALIMTAR